MASAAAAFNARFRRGHEAPQAEPRVGEILSDSSEGSASVEIAPRAAASRATSRASSSSTEEKTAANKSPAPVSKRRSKQAKRTGKSNWYIDSDNEEEGDEYVKLSAAGSMAAENSPRDSKEKDDGGSAARGSSSEPTTLAADRESKEDAVAEAPEEKGSVQPVVKEPPRLKRLTEPGGGTPKAAELEADSSGVLSPLSDSDTPRSGGGHVSGKKQTSFQKLMAKTKTLSPFAARHKGLESAGGVSSLPTSRGNDLVDDSRHSSASASASASESRADASKASRLSSGGAPPSISQRRGSKLQVTTNLGTPTSTLVSNDLSSPGDPPTSTTSTGAFETPAQAPMPIINRRTSRLKQSPSNSDYGTGGGSSTPRSGNMSPAMSTEAGMRRTLSYETPDSLSPGQRKQPGAFPGHPGSGVLLEGWLRQKQRRGMKGMKKWNSRYFVLYAKTNEVRYYADVVPSAWGPLPLGEIGSISLRLIQRIGKPSHPKYKGCRFDITCRNTWGTHYADDYVSSDDENSNNNNDEVGSNGANTGGKPEKSGTPKSSRVYSLIADSPQVTVTWVNTLDSLLTRSANSPRPDVSSPSTGSKMKKMPPSKTLSRRRSSALDVETVVVCGPQDAVPRAVTFAIHYIFNSSPGVETPHFYELEADVAKLKNALKFLNRFAEGDGSTSASEQKPGKDELASVLDPVTAGAVVRTWLRQLEQPLVPFEMFPDFRTLAADAAADAATEKFELSRNLKALLDALPPKNRAMLACLLFHLNDVNAYASANSMDAEVLSTLFAEFVLRPRPDDALAPKEHADIQRLVKEMIVSVDSLIDEDELDGLA